MERGLPRGNERLPQVLDRLKRNGGNVLVLGTDTAAQEAVCDRLQGSDADDRYRVLVRATGEPVDKSAAQTAVMQDSDDLRSLASSVVEAVDGFESSTAGFSPGQLRVCVESLQELVTNHGREAVFRLLHVLGARVGRADGIGHYHLHTGPGEQTAGLLEPLFDAVLEVRATEERLEQRWRIDEANLETDWLSL